MVWCNGFSFYWRWNRLRKAWCPLSGGNAFADRVVDAGRHQQVEQALKVLGFHGTDRRSAWRPTAAVVVALPQNRSELSQMASRRRTSAGWQAASEPAAVQRTVGQCDAQ